MADTDRDTLSFLQAEGLAPLPQQLELRSISKEMRSLLWAAVYQSIGTGTESDETTSWKTHLSPKWRAVMYRWHVFHEHLPADEYTSLYKHQSSLLKALIWNSHYGQVFEWITFVLRDPNCPPGFKTSISRALESSRAAYRIAGNTVYPIGSPEEAETVSRAFTDLSKSEAGGARSHLAEAGRLLTSGDFAGSVRESIHAVESVAKLVEPKAKTLSDALMLLDRGGRINPNLKRGLNALYDYSSDEKGIRHAKVFGPDAAVDEADALFMLGACAAFVSYLLRRAGNVPQS